VQLLELGQLQHIWWPLLHTQAFLRTLEEVGLNGEELVRKMSTYKKRVQGKVRDKLVVFQSGGQGLAQMTGLTNSLVAEIKNRVVAEFMEQLPHLRFLAPKGISRRVCWQWQQGQGAGW
jgi:hypothetical protein